MSTPWSEIVERLREQEKACRPYDIAGQSHKQHVKDYPTVVLALAEAEKMVNTSPINEDGLPLGAALIPVEPGECLGLLHGRKSDLMPERDSADQCK